MAGFAVAALAAAAALTPTQGPGEEAAEPRPETVLVLDFEVQDQGVNGADDEEIASLAREAARLFRERIRQDGRFALVEPSAPSGGPAARSGSPGASCGAPACAREAARDAGATRVVRGRYVKVSNLIRYLAVELVDPSTGQVLRSAVAELKGQRDVVLERAVANLYRDLRRPSARPGSRPGA